MLNTNFQDIMQVTKQHLPITQNLSTKQFGYLVGDILHNVAPSHPTYYGKEKQFLNCYLNQLRAQGNQVFQWDNMLLLYTDLMGR